ncbi:MAG TPA: GNAT family N-acetyltransferase [Candidatus Lokiarchaeia archaeon]|nr:GNAT family N-acetyltransferase [Candidatus Lokiarchaeia archaeon]
MAMELLIKPASPADITTLAKMNLALINDEGSRNPMTLQELEDRMRDWLAGEYSATFIIFDGKIAGYCLYQVRKDEYFLENTEVYVRQFYIKPEFRRQHVGSYAFEQITADWFSSENTTVILDVLENNSAARQFWSQLGFMPYYTRMRKTC